MGCSSEQPIFHPPVARDAGSRIEPHRRSLVGIAAANPDGLPFLLLHTEPSRNPHVHLLAFGMGAMTWCFRFASRDRPSHSAARRQVPSMNRPGWLADDRLARRAALAVLEQPPSMEPTKPSPVTGLLSMIEPAADLYVGIASS